MTIQLVVKATDYQRRVDDSPSGHYETIVGQTTRWHDVGGHLLDGMLQAQSNVGKPVHWVNLTQTIAKGTVYNDRHGGQDRVLVADPENADGEELIDAMLWVSGN
ncbi:MAG: hypothetical protein JO214_14035 [Frankiaceae bacterium]|nr:hypothetical protein [Frankiaceae bacterium]